MYGVVRCGHCGRPQGVRLEAKTRRCACGHRLDLRRLRPLFTTGDPRELPAALGRIRAEGTGQLEAYDETVETGALADALPPEAPVLPARVRRERGLEALRDLTEATGGFRWEEGCAVLEALGVAGDDLLESLRRENLLYEAAPGRYRLV